MHTLAHLLHQTSRDLRLILQQLLKQKVDTGLIDDSILPCPIACENPSARVWGLYPACSETIWIQCQSTPCPLATPSGWARQGFSSVVQDKLHGIPFRAIILKGPAGMPSGGTSAPAWLLRSSPLDPDAPACHKWALGASVMVRAFFTENRAERTTKQHFSMVVKTFHPFERVKTGSSITASDHLRPPWACLWPVHVPVWLNLQRTTMHAHGKPGKHQNSVLLPQYARIPCTIHGELEIGARNRCGTPRQDALATPDRFQTGRTEARGIIIPSDRILTSSATPHCNGKYSRNHPPSCRSSYMVLR